MYYIGGNKADGDEDEGDASGAEQVLPDEG
jgi:hypothetical protein